MKSLFIFMLLLVACLTVSVSPVKARRLPYCSEQTLSVGCNPQGTQCTQLIQQTCNDCDPNCRTWTTYYTRDLYD